MSEMRAGISYTSSLSRFSTWRICSREQAKSECDWLVMSSVFVASLYQVASFSVRANKFTKWKTCFNYLCAIRRQIICKEKIRLQAVTETFSYRSCAIELYFSSMICATF